MIPLFLDNSILLSRESFFGIIQIKFRQWQLNLEPSELSREFNKSIHGSQQTRFKQSAGFFS